MACWRRMWNVDEWSTIFSTSRQMATIISIDSIGYFPCPVPPQLSSKRALKRIACEQHQVARCFPAVHQRARGVLREGEGVLRALAVSPESMTQSVPSNTALATSDVSARVGRGLLIIESSICVAVTTGLPAMLHFEIIIFCANATFSPGISTPRSPRATMMASVTCPCRRTQVPISACPRPVAK